MITTRSSARLAVVLAGCALAVACDPAAKPDPARTPAAAAEVAGAPAATSAKPARPAPAQPAPAAKIFRDDTYGFSVASARTPTEQDQQVPTDVGPVQARFYTFSAASAPGAIMVAVTPSAVFKGGSAEQILDGAEAGAIKNMGGTLVGSEPIELDGNPGRALHFTVKPQGHAATGEARLFLRDGALYQVLEIHMDSASAFAAEGRAVLDSFAFVPKRR
ncbi:MAG: hypothetical protein R3B06_27870 [Kofleriaceae bacterium]